MAMAAKAKLLLRELKMVKSDLAFAKQRCAQLEEENKVLRENRSGDSQTDDDDLVLILFTLYKAINVNISLCTFLISGCVFSLIYRCGFNWKHY